MRRTAVMLGINLALGSAALAWILSRLGSPALALLSTHVSGLLLLAFGATVLVGLVALALRWRILLAGVGVAPGLARMTAIRAAGQSLSILVPSAKLGGEPLRVYLLTRCGTPGGGSLASVAVDRTVEAGTATACAGAFALLLVARGVPGLGGALTTLGLAAAALALGVFLAVRRLERGAGLATALARLTRLDRLGTLESQLEVLSAADRGVAHLARQPRRLSRALAVGAAANAVVLLEYYLLLSAFDLPADPVAVIAAIFAAGAAHSLPVPAAVGALEATEMWLFGVLGHPPAVGLAVGLAVRLRDFAWVLPGILYLAGGGLWPGGVPAGATPAPASNPG